VRKKCVCLPAALWFAVVLTGQEPDFAELRGEVRQEHTILFERLMVSLYDYSLHQEVASVPLAGDGSFTLRRIPFRTYSVRITNEMGEVVQESMLTVNQRTQPLEILLPARADARPASGPVSVRQLRRHSPARKAFSAFVEAQHFSESQQYDKAAEELEKAIRISPDFAEAHSNLAVQYIRLKRFEDALGELDRASGIAGPNSRNLANRAFALQSVGRHQEAVESARAAVRMDPGNVQAQYLLGNLLARDSRTIRESVGHLERAADTMPVARDALTKVRAMLR
jgi:tetratricopeptide (TPR) repeat protein